MLDKKTEDFLDKVAMCGKKHLKKKVKKATIVKEAAGASTGMSQYKKRTVKKYEDKSGEGAAAGGTLGLAAGHLIGKNMGRGGNIARALGLIGGALTGYGVGKKGKKTKRDEAIMSDS